MNRWVFVRPLLDKYKGMTFSISVTANSGGPVEHRVIENRDALVKLFQRASVEKLIVGVDDAVSKNQQYDSGPISITREQEDILTGHK